MTANVNGRGIHKFAEQTNLCRDSMQFSRTRGISCSIMGCWNRNLRHVDVTALTVTQSLVLYAPSAPSVRGKLGLFSFRREKYNMSYVIRDLTCRRYVRWNMYAKCWKYCWTCTNICMVQRCSGCVEIVAEICLPTKRDTISKTSRKFLFNSRMFGWR